jgi:hypothetical protein
MLMTEKGKPDSTARQVLGILAEKANEQGRNSHPSVLRIRYATGLDDRTIERALLRLERGKLIEDAGRTYSGTRRWNLAMHRVRGQSEWDDLVADAEAAKQLESDRRKARRHRATSADSSRVRDAECGHPGVSVPMSGTQSADVRDAESGIRDGKPPEPPEPPVNHPHNHPGTVLGGTLPPSPLRPQEPPTSALGTEEANSFYEPVQPPQDVEGDSRPRTRENEAHPPALRLVEGGNAIATNNPAPRGIWPAGVPNRGTQASESIAEAMARVAAARQKHRNRGAAG